MSDSKEEKKGIPGVIYPAEFYVQKQNGKKWEDRGVYQSSVRIDENQEIHDSQYMERRACFGIGADKKNISKFRVNKIVVDYTNPLCRGEFLKELEEKWMSRL